MNKITMTDIIERLRIESRREPHEPIWRDAIDEIEALRAEVGRLRADLADLLEALQEIVSAADGEGWSQLDATFSKARAAIAKATTGQKGGKP